MRSFEYTIKDALGIHARPAGLLVKTAKPLDSVITIAKGEKTAIATGLLALMNLGVKQGDVISVRIVGGDEAASEQVMRRFLQEHL